MITPPYLQPGDRVGVLALASHVEYSALQEGLRIMREDWQLEVVEGQTLHLQHHQFAGTDDQRAHDFQTMLDDPSIKAIFSVRGGYGTSRIIDKIQFDTLKQNPKWIVGFSDITVAHCHLHRLGVESIHSIMPKQFGQSGYEESLKTLKQALFGEKLFHVASTHELNRKGRCEGQVVGGNLCLLAHLIGSKSAPDTRRKILFIEDVDEYLYNLDRLMIQLKRAKKLQQLAGLIVGQFTHLKDNDTVPFGKTAYEIIAEHTAEFHYPVCYDFPVGHDTQNVAMLIGRRASLNVTDNFSLLIFEEI
ncbi:MAG: LD-carboxypeptidase [Runella sp.]